MIKRQKPRNLDKHHTLAHKSRIAGLGASDNVPKYFYLNEEGEFAGSHVPNRRAISPQAGSELAAKGEIRRSAREMFVNKGVEHRGEGSKRARKRAAKENNASLLDMDALKSLLLPQVAEKFFNAWDNIFYPKTFANPICKHLIL